MAKLSNPERIKRLQNHLAALKAGGSVSKRDMQSLLTDDQVKQFEDEWQGAQDYKQSIISGRSELESYSAKLKAADAIWNRYENTKTANKKAETEYAAQAAYEAALEHLEELLDANPAIELYLDRPVCLAAGHECDPSVGEVPRYRLSKSHYAIAEQFETKRDIKVKILERSIQALLSAKEAPSSAPNFEELGQTIANLRNHRTRN